MFIKTKHFLLIAGIITVTVSFLFFGRKHDVYTILLGVGIVLSSVSFLWIILSSDSLKNKLLWTGIAIVGGVVHLTVEPLLIKSSYRIYITQHEQKLASINNILRDKDGKISITRDSVFSKGDQINAIEKRNLLNAREEVGAYIISKYDNVVYYGLWGFFRCQNRNHLQS